MDGLNIKQAPKGEFLGYGYLNLPLANAKKTTHGKETPTGPNCWTLFLNSSNFKGPVAFFTPYFWSHSTLNNPSLAGQLLDSRPVDPNTQIQMETQYIPCRVAKDSKGDSYARISPTSFPQNFGKQSALVHRSTSYNSNALYNSVAAWFGGGKLSTGQVDMSGAHVRTFPGRGSATWEIRTPQPDGKDKRVPISWNSFATPSAVAPFTFGYKWNESNVTQHDKLVTLPEYFRLEEGSDSKKDRWIPIQESMVPTETNLMSLKWDRPVENAEEPYVTPAEPKSTWKQPGPAAGPFKAHLGDGTVVTYYWYRFADQPSLLNADLTLEEREQMQKKVEKIHRSWPKDHNYLAPPNFGKLASIDPALIVKPPKGLEIGYVPIATKQELANHK